MLTLEQILSTGSMAEQFESLKVTLTERESEAVAQESTIKDQGEKVTTLEADAVAKAATHTDEIKAASDKQVEMETAATKQGKQIEAKDATIAEQAKKLTLTPFTDAQKKEIEAVGGGDSEGTEAAEKTGEELVAEHKAIDDPTKRAQFYKDNKQAMDAVFDAPTS